MDEGPGIVKLEKFSDNIWIAQQKLRALGLEVGTKMTIIDTTGNGDLFIHSPIIITEKLKKEIAALGIVRFIVAPNRFHHLFLKQAQSLYPQAKIYAVPGLIPKRSDIANLNVLDNNLTYPWSKTIKHHLIGGAPLLNECAFFHSKSGTLLLTDIAINFGHSAAPLTKIAMLAIGHFNKFGPSIFEKLIFIRDKKLFDASITTIMRWRFDKIIIAHGTPVKENGYELFRSKFLRKNKSTTIAPGKQ